MQLIITNVFECQLVRRLPEILAEVLDCADIGLLCQRRHVADRHVVDHAPPQRRHLLTHGILLSVELHERAILSDRMLSRDEHFPIVSHRQGSENSYFPTYREWLC